MIVDGGTFFDYDPRFDVGIEPDDLCMRLAEFGAAKALSLSFRGVLDHYRHGNQRTLEVCSGHDMLVAVATINPSAFDGDTTYLADLTAKGFRALALFPQWQGWSWSALSAERVVEVAGEAGLVVQGAATDLASFGAACRCLGASGRPAMVRFLERGGYSVVPELLAAAERYPNLHFDVGCLPQSGIIAHLAGRIGSERLYLGSGAPLTFEGAAYFSLAASQLSAEDRAMIEAGTLTRLLGFGEVVPRPSGSELFEKFRAAPKVDTHWHTGTWHLVEPRISFEHIREELDLFNIEATCSSSITALNWDIEEGNAETERLMAEDHRVHGLVVISPRDPELSLREAERLSDNPRFVGLKTIQDYYQDRGPMRLDHPAYAPMLQWADRNRWPVMAHLQGMYEAAKTYRNATFIAAHATWNFTDLATLPNVYFDIATSSSLRKDADFLRLVAAVGSDRVIFSSDSQLMGTAWTLGKLASSGLEWPVIKKILHDNALSAFPRLQCRLREAA